MILEYAKNFVTAVTKPETVSHRPIHIQVEPTSYCNLACKMCIRNDTVKQPRHMSLEKFKRVVDQIRPKKITYAGVGEPTLNMQLPEMIEYAASKGADSMISSNLTLGEKVLSRVAKSGPKVIKISIDAADKETYIKVRGEDFHDRILAGIGIINKCKKELGRDYPELRFDFVILKDNYHQFIEVLKIAKRYDISTTYFRVLQSVGLGEERERDLRADFDLKDLFNKLVAAREFAEREHIHSNLSFLVKDYNHLKSIYEEQNGHYEGKVCLLPWLQSFVSVDGHLSPCCATHSNSQVSMGNIFSQDFDEVWNGAAYQSLRREFKSGKKMGICSDCVPRSLEDLVRMARMVPSFMKF